MLPLSLEVDGGLIRLRGALQYLLVELFKESASPPKHILIINKLSRLYVSVSEIEAHEGIRLFWLEVRLLVVVLLPAVVLPPVLLFPAVILLFAVHFLPAVALVPVRTKTAPLAR